MFSCLRAGHQKRNLDRFHRCRTCNLSGVYVALLSGQPVMTMAGGNAVLGLLIIMNGFLLLSMYAIWSALVEC